MFTENHSSQMLNLCMMSSKTPSFTQCCCSREWTWLQWCKQRRMCDIQCTYCKFLFSPSTHFPSYTVRPYVEVTGFGISDVEPLDFTTIVLVMLNFSWQTHEIKQKLSYCSLSLPDIKQGITSILSWLLTGSHTNMYLSNLRNGIVWCCRCIGLKVTARGYICSYGIQLVRRGKLWH